MTLESLEKKDKEQFILDNQEAFQIATFGVLDSPLEEEPVISRQDIEGSLAKGKAYRICLDGERVGGAVVSINGDKGDLELLFISPNMQGKGIGYTAWALLEKVYPEVKI
ncbi:GNAT family N-acetyltransferase [Streptococcus porcorum]|uniref:GNAT superfamily N-acetyltransferase n=1 Tax=Streptococcus porcorum TaxID=701526 RepID=A0ABV2JG48_9STRE